eukprot:c17250_g1_i3.p1 GENE.c17250_g1_i3~~c17250_g1_i3.p1  ORF type:complete len:434 (+),score=194.83 c17250_g1_i3:32-1303(+)
MKYQKLPENRQEELILKAKLEQSVCEGGAVPICTCIWGPSIFLVLPILLLLNVYQFEVVFSYVAIFFSIILLLVGTYIFIKGIKPLLLPPPATPLTKFPLTKDYYGQIKPKKAFVLVNPKGGKGLSTNIFKNIVKPKFEAAGVEITLVETQYSGHCRDFCRTSSFDEHDSIIAIGGDGTFHECVDGMLKRKDGKKLRIGLIPGGSGNSFLSDFELGSNVEQAVESILDGYVSNMDVLEVRNGPEENNLIYAVNVIGYTEDHCLSALNVEGWRWIFGKARYDICAFWGILKHRSSTATVYCDGQEWRQAGLALFITNTQYFGNHMRATPSASLDDGFCEVACVDGTRGEVLRYLSLIKTGAHEKLTEIKSCKKIMIRFPNDMGLFNLDGEIFPYYHNTLEVTNIQNAYLMYVPSKDRYKSLLSQ